MDLSQATCLSAILWRPQLRFTNGSSLRPFLGKNTSCSIYPRSSIQDTKKLPKLEQYTTLSLSVFMNS